MHKCSLQHVPPNTLETNRMSTVREVKKIMLYFHDSIIQNYKTVQKIILVENPYDIMLAFKKQDSPSRFGLVDKALA